MNRNIVFAATAVLCIGFCAASCGEDKLGANEGAPPPLKVESVQDRNLFTVDHPDRFPLTKAIAHDAPSELRTTGVVTPDISRTVPVISIAAGRVVDIKARLGDVVKKGQVLLLLQSSDIAGAYSDYQKAVADEKLSQTQLERAKLLYDKGVISQNDFQIAEDTDAKAKVDLKTSAEKLRVLGTANLDQPSGTVEVRAPISGVITDQ
jgi:cobalt-zinc-cadmium efflux system membrane fusion protein